MSEYDFANQCANEMVQYLLDTQTRTKASASELAEHKEAFIEKCFEEYKRNDFYDINLDYFRWSVMDLYQKKVETLSALSM